MELYINGKLYINGELVNKQMLVDNGVIVKIADGIFADCEIIDLNGKSVYPAFFDEHIHGAYGVDFTVSERSELLRCLDALKADGVGTVFATLMSEDVAVLAERIALLSEIAKERSILKGVHLEGPFLSKKYKGAMDESRLLAPSVEVAKRLIEAGNGIVKLITLAPELEGAEELIRYLVSVGVSVNMGHSNGTFEEASNGLKSGADGFTHTFNAMRPIDRKEPSILGCALNSEGYAEIIPDGRHVHPTLVNMLYKLKGTKTVVITDGIAASGLKDGEYLLGNTPVEVIGDDAFLVGTQTRAGSVITARRAVESFAKICGLTFEQALPYMTSIPSKRFNINTGEIKEGYLAEFYIK